MLHPMWTKSSVTFGQPELIATLITNGYLLSHDRIRRLNRAGLDHLQISIDNVVPDDVSKKSLKLLDQKLRWLAEIAEFDITVNSVVGGGIRNPDDAVVIARRARQLGLSTTVGIIHDGHGELRSLDDNRPILDRIVSLGGTTFDFATSTNCSKTSQTDVRTTGTAALAAALVCLRRRTRPLVLAAARTPGNSAGAIWAEDLQRQCRAVKSCAPNCTVGCVHRVAQLDELRQDPQTVLAQWFPAAPGDRRLRLFRSGFSSGSSSPIPITTFFRNAAARLFGAGHRG